MFRKLLFLGLMLFVPSSVQADDVDPATSMLVDTCVACHGKYGSSTGPAIPTIAGTSVNHFYHTMLAYKNDQRQGTVMNRIAKGYEDADFKLMAAYFAKQPFMRFQQEFDPAKASKGAELHEQYCSVCHVEGGFIEEEGSNIIAGQWLAYLEFNLHDFVNGERDMPKQMQRQLKKMTKKHGNESLEQVAHFYASQIKKPAE